MLKVLVVTLALAGTGFMADKCDIDITQLGGGAE